MKQPKNLDELLAAMLDGSFVLEGGAMSPKHLPTFGGEPPREKYDRSIFSWDATRFLIQTAGGWRIVPRSERERGAQNLTFAAGR